MRGSEHRVTSCPGLPGTVSVLVPKIPHPGKLLSPGQIETVGGHRAPEGQLGSGRRQASSIQQQAGKQPRVPRQSGRAEKALATQLQSELRNKPQTSVTSLFLRNPDSQRVMNPLHR